MYSAKKTVRNKRYTSNKKNKFVGRDSIVLEYINCRSKKRKIETDENSFSTIELPYW